ncbi:hypothetical protein [Deinococcus sp.]|uniref:hypothetical protein n=1 Tax=Deinococcus sp. TaxID=47478 RepID=UPI002869A889|nr:hypothetical protein [Deinococcus sp.]
MGQGVELGFVVGHFFVTWDNAADEELSVRPGRMVDFLREGIFENVSEHPDWQGHIGRSLGKVDVLENEAILTIGGKQVYIVTAKVDPETLHIDALADNLVVYFSADARDSFFAQYPDPRPG